MIGESGGNSAHRGLDGERLVAFLVRVDQSESL
jgi:hypothetical protein